MIAVFKQKISRKLFFLGFGLNYSFERMGNSMARVITKAASKAVNWNWFWGIAAGFGAGYMLALTQHQAELSRLLGSL